MTWERIKSTNPVLIIGGGGFLGTNLANRLSETGHRVVSLSRSWLSPRPMQGVTHMPPAENQSQQINDLISSSSCVFHMAHGSSPSTSLGAMEDDLISSMRLNFQVIRACAASGVPLIYLSSGGAVYGKEAPIPTPENAPTLPISPYGAAKLTAEHYLHIAALHLGLDYRVLRISNPYGPWQLGTHRQGVIGTWMKQILRGGDIEIWGDGSVVRDYIFVEDVIDAMVGAMNYNGRAQIFNIGAGQGVSLNQLFSQLNAVCDRPVSCTHRDAAPADVPISVLDCALARKEFGWAPQTPLTEGLARTWQWMKAFQSDGEL